MATSYKIVLLLARAGDNFLVTRFLKKKGFEILNKLPNGVKQKDIDAILLDIRLGKAKIEEALSFKRKAPLFLPLIALVPGQVTPEMYYKLGFDDCWHYPIYQEELFRRLKFFLRFREKMRELKEKEESQRLESLGFLAIGIAHDFNNLLTPILGYADLCSLKTKEDEVKHYLERIKEAVLKSRELIEQIFLFCNPTKDSEQEIDLVQEVKKLSSLLKTVIPKEIVLNIDFPSESIWVKLHPSKLHRLLLNLITNAVKATEGKSGHINLKILKEGQNALLLVQDTGKGLDEVTQKKIFDLFYSTGITTGIGLNIVKNIVKEANGEIVVESQKGIGTTFKIYFPLQEEISQTRIAHLYQKLPQITGKILVVDDEITILELFKQFLETIDFEVLTASSGEEALKIFDDHQEEIILLISDYFLADLKGDELARRVKEKAPRLPVIFCTGLQEEIALPGYSDIRTLPKPFSFTELQELLKELLDHQKKQISAI